jgi:hypothetical protein
VIYDFFVWLFGSGIASLVVFLPVQPEYQNDTLVIRARLANPMTSQVHRLVSHGLEFGINYDCTIIINDTKTFGRSQSNRTTFTNGIWRVNGAATSEGEVQARQGAVQFSFEKFRFDKGDELFIYIKAAIVPDTEFTASTGLKTGILWNYYEPHCKQKFVYLDGQFIAD